LFCTLILSATTSLQAASGGLQFDGSNDYVTLGQAPGLGLGQFTIETWFKRTGAGTTTSTGSGGVTAVPLVTKGRGEADGSNLDMNWFLGINSASNALTADFEEGAAGTAPGLNHPVTGVTPVALNTWYHAAVTYDGAKWQLFLNGVLETELVVGQPPRSDSVQHAALASALTSTGVAAGYFAGILDEVRVWNYARSAAEIQTTMLQQIPTAPGLVGRWALDEATGLTAADSSGSGINGTLTSGPLWVPGYVFVPAPTVQLVSPASQFFSTSRNVTFTVSAQDQTGLTSATLQVGKAPVNLVLSGPSESVDTYISAATPADNYGAATALNVDGEPHAHGLLKFPNLFGLNRVPAGARISSATLKVNCSNYGVMMKAYRLTQDWDENTVNWTLRTATESWGDSGADGATSHAATEVNADCTAIGWRTIDLTAFVQEWSDGQPNYGIVLVDTGTDGVDFTTSESATPPELTVVVQADMQPVATETLSGTSATVTFNTTLEDAQTYQWNCLVANQGGESAWAPVSYTLTVDGNYPDFPALITPASNATEVAVAPELSATVSDPNGDALEV
ncbi:MAG: DNRLRE domain-containing protein, partial [Desulfobacterales bacterium]|nr:DNRLRE domain-containing protein [Desulfobacterales bacterium]